MSSQLFSEDLFEKVLIEPAEQGAKDLYVVSGYASPAMVTRHFQELIKRGMKAVNLDLQIGMAARDGISIQSLACFQSLAQQLPGNEIKSRFKLGAPIHSKVYVWCSEEGPVRAFAGSADYTQTGFGIGALGSNQIESCVEVEPNKAFDLVIDMAGQSISCTDPDLRNQLAVLDAEPPSGEIRTEAPIDFEQPNIGADFVLLPLVQTTKQPGEIHNSGAGLNWGQRGTRNPDEAYVPIPIGVQRRQFFPQIGVHFQIMTDDGETFSATVAQANGKALETPQDNSILGRYFRRKLGLVPGAYINTEDLRKFGSNAVEITRLDDEHYYMSYRPGIKFPL